MKTLLKNIRTAGTITLFLMIICGVIYPLLMTGVGQLLFPVQANGNIVEYKGTPVGAKLVGQAFTDKRFMKGRPSAVNYNTYTLEDKKDGTYTGVSSGSTNYAPSNPELVQNVETTTNTILQANPSVKVEDIPVDLVTSSGSGLDPHISKSAATIQIPALAVATGLSEETLQQIVANHTIGKLLGIFGEETVNVLGVNLEIASKIGL